MMNLINELYEEQGFIAVADFVAELTDEQEEELLKEIRL